MRKNRKCVMAAIIGIPNFSIKVLLVHKYTTLLHLSCLQCLWLCANRVSQAVEIIYPTCTTFPFHSAWKGIM